MNKQAKQPIFTFRVKDGWYKMRNTITEYSNVNQEITAMSVWETYLKRTAVLALVSAGRIVSHKQTQLTALMDVKLDAAMIRAIQEKTNKDLSKARNIKKIISSMYPEPVVEEVEEDNEDGDEYDEVDEA